MKIADLNEISWKIAAQSLIPTPKKKGVRWEVCSKGKLREMYEKTKEDDFISAIKGIISDYIPPDRNKEKYLKNFGNELLKSLQGMNRDDAKILLQYILWNANTLEILFGKDEKELRNELERRFASEGVDKDELVESIIEYWKQGLSVASTKAGRFSERRGKFEDKKSKRSKKPWEDMRREYLQRR
jgi:hypothetical protein